MDYSPEEGSIGNCLSVGCYRTVFVKIKVNKARTKWAQDIVYESEGIFAGPMLNEDLSNEWQERMWTSFGRCVSKLSQWPWQMSGQQRLHSLSWLTFKWVDTWILSSPILTRTILRNDTLNELGLYGIDDIVRRPCFDNPSFWGWTHGVSVDEQHGQLGLETREQG